MSGKRVVISNMHVLPGMYQHLSLTVDEYDGKRYTIVRNTVDSMPLLLRNYTGNIEVAMERNKLIISDGRRRKTAAQREVQS